MFVVVLANCLWWGSRIPFDGAPDEADHYVLQEFVSQHGRLPRYGEAGFVVHLMDSGNHERLPVDLDPQTSAELAARRRHFEMRQTYLFSPQLPYVLGGWFGRLLGGTSVLEARLFSALCVALAAVVTSCAGWILWRDAVSATVAGLCVGLWPQMTFLGAYVNDDAFSVLAVGVLVLALAFERRYGLDTRGAFLLGIGLGMTGASKYNVLAIAPLVIVWGSWRWRQQRGRFLRPAGLALLLALAIAGPWFARNAVLYGGDPFARLAVNQHVEEAAASLSPELRARTKLLGAQSPRDQGATWSQILQRGWMAQTLESFWGRFGWMRIGLSRLLYGSALLVILAMLAGSMYASWWSRDPGSTGLPMLPGLVALPFLALLIGTSLLNSYFIDYQPQGRYLLASVPPLCLQLVAGFAGHRTRLVRLAPVVLVLFFMVQNLIANLAYLR